MKQVYVLILVVCVLEGSPNVIGKSLLISNNSLSSSLPIMENSGTTLHSLLNWGKGKGGNLEKPDWVD